MYLFQLGSKRVPPLYILVTHVQKQETTEGRKEGVLCSTHTYISNRKWLLIDNGNDWIGQKDVKILKSVEGSIFNVKLRFSLKLFQVNFFPFIFQSQTNVVPTMADVVSFACLHQSEESVHAQKDSFLKTMGKHATVIYSVLRQNLCITWHGTAVARKIYEHSRQ